MGGGTKSTTTQTPQAQDPALAGLTASSAQRAQEFQNQLPIGQFAQATPTKVAGLSAREQQGYGMIPQLGEIGRRKVTGENLPTSPSLAAARQSFQQAYLPNIENQAALGGLSRSTALSNATAAAEAQYMQPLIEAELAREQQANQNEYAATAAQIQALTGAGATERGIEQAGYESEAQDLLRRQALGEQATYGVLGQLIPTAFGQTSKTKGKQGIFTVFALFSMTYLGLIA